MQELQDLYFNNILFIL